ncbi:MAG TPA: CdaR family protein, partial [bacterium]|nr:CdaR family protein [bacterium]
AALYFNEPILLILAVILWVTITGQGTADRIIRDIPYQIRNIPGGMELTDKGAGVIQVRVRGPKSLVPTLKPADFTVSMKLPDGIESGPVPLQITHSNVITPYSNQLSILQILPSSVTVYLDRVVQKSVRIQPFLKGSPNPDFELGEYRVSPPCALLEGPQSVLEGIDVVYTEPIDVGGQTLSFDDRVLVKPQSTLIRVIEPSRVTARVEITERITERSFPEFELTLVPRNGDLGYAASPSVVTLTIIGPAATLNQLKPSDIQLVADCTELPPGTHTVRPVLVTGEDRITLVSIEPEDVEVLVPDPTPTPSPTPSASPTYAVSPTN